MCFVTIPTKKFSENFVRKIEHICDTVLEVETFQGTSGTIKKFNHFSDKEKVNSVFHSFDGFFSVKKIPR